MEPLGLFQYIGRHSLASSHPNERGRFLEIGLLEVGGEQVFIENLFLALQVVLGGLAASKVVAHLSIPVGLGQRDDCVVVPLLGKDIRFSTYSTG